MLMPGNEVDGLSSGGNAPNVPAMPPSCESSSNPVHSVMYYTMRAWNEERRSVLQQGIRIVDTPTDRLLRWERGETPAPWYVNVFPTNRCNLRCAICWQRRFDEFAAEVPDDRFLRFVDECADLGAREWCFAGGGEPVMRAELVVQMCERIRARGMNGAFMTNGVSFKLEYFLRLARAGWSSLVFSLDGPTPEINDAIRSKGSFERATETIRKMKKAREEHGLATPSFALHATLTSLNFDKLDKLAELAHELGCDAVGAANLTDAGPHCEPFRLTKEQLAVVPEHVRHASERARELGLSDYFSDVLSERDYHRPRIPEGAAGMLRAMCFEPWLGIAVHADGRVGPCCVYWEENAGSLFESDLRDIWLGPHLQKVREDILAGRLPAYCAKCSPAPPSLGVRDGCLRRQLAEARANPPWDQLRFPQRQVALARKAVSSIRRHGLLQAMRRGKQWIDIRKQ